ARPNEVCQFADLVDLDVVRLLADLTRASQESLDDFAVTVRGGVRDSVMNDHVPVALEGDPSEPCDQWFPTLPFGPGLEAGPQPVRCLDFDPVTGGHLRHRTAVLGGQGPE